MKYFFLIIFVFASFTSFTQIQQPKWRVGLDISGISSRLITPENDTQFPTEDFARSGLGYSFGAILQRDLTNSFSVSIGINYAQKLRKTYDKITMPNETNLKSIRRELTEQSVEIPIMAHLRFGELPDRPRLKFILSAGISINSDLKLRSNGYFIDPDFLVVINGKENELPEINPATKLLGSIAPIIGIGFNYQISPKVLWVIQPFARWDYGLREDIAAYKRFNLATTSFGLKSYLLFSL
jgi:hypothetical protein